MYIEWIYVKETWSTAFKHIDLKTLTNTLGHGIIIRISQNKMRKFLNIPEVEELLATVKYTNEM